MYRCGADVGEHEASVEALGDPSYASRFHQRNIILIRRELTGPFRSHSVKLCEIRLDSKRRFGGGLDVFGESRTRQYCFSPLIRMHTSKPERSQGAGDSIAHDGAMEQNDTISEIVHLEMSGEK